MLVGQTEANEESSPYCNRRVSTLPEEDGAGEKHSDKGVVEGEHFSLDAVEPDKGRESVEEGGEGCGDGDGGGEAAGRGGGLGGWGGGGGAEEGVVAVKGDAECCVVPGSIVTKYEGRSR